MSRRFRACSLDQLLLLPPSIQEWLPDGHLARFIAEVCEELDLRPILAVYDAKDGRGRLGYHPLLLTRLLLYGYCTGVRSSRRIEKATYDDVAFRYLAADQHPDHDTLAAFRQEHLELLAGLFTETLRLCQAAGMIKLGVVAIDGTKIKANANSRRATTYSHLVERDRELEALSKRLLEDAARIDAEEDQRFGKGNRGDELPPELATVEQRRAKIREAKKALEDEAKQRAEQAAQERVAAGGKPRNEAEKKRWMRAKSGKPAPAARYNFVDPDSRIMKDSGANAFLQGYNAQVAVDGEGQVILAAAITNEVNDKHQLLPMVALVKLATGRNADHVVADAGYWKAESVTAAELLGSEVLVPPDGHVTRGQGAVHPNAPRNEAACMMREKLRVENTRQIYQKRQGIVEPVFGQIKEHRGFRRTLLRGMSKVQAEWRIICLTHNLLKLFGQRQRLQPA